MSQVVANAVMSQPNPMQKIGAYFWGDNGQQLTPQQAAAQQQVANAMIGNAPAPHTIGEGLNAIGRAIVARKMSDSSSAAIEAGTGQATKDLQTVIADPTKASAFLANDAYATDAQKAVAQAYLSQEMMKTNPDMIMTRAFQQSEINKNNAETGMYANGGQAQGSPIQDANGNYYIATQYGGNMRPLAAGGGSQPPASTTPPQAVPDASPVQLLPDQAVPPQSVPGPAPVAAPVGGSAPAAASVPSATAAAVAPSAGPVFLTPAQQAAAKAQGEDTGKISAALPQQMVAAHTALQQLDDSDKLVSGKIDQAIVLAQKLAATGWAGKLSEALPGSPAYALARTLDTIKANVGFDKLQAMRAASPTGGALGSISNMEEQLLQSVLGSLDQGQDAPTITSNLLDMKGFLVNNSLQRKQAYNADFKNVTPLSGDKSFNHVELPGGSFASDNWGSKGVAPILAHNAKTGQTMRLFNGQWVDING